MARLIDKIIHKLATIQNDIFMKGYNLGHTEKGIKINQNIEYFKTKWFPNFKENLELYIVSLIDILSLFLLIALAIYLYNSLKFNMIKILIFLLLCHIFILVLSYLLERLEKIIVKIKNKTFF